MSVRRIRAAYKGCVVEFPYARLEVSQEPVYGDDGFTLEATRYEFAVSGVLTADTVEAFAALVYKVRAVLPRPGGGFGVETSPDGVTFTSLYTFEGDDVDWGPKPGVFRMTTLTGLSAIYSYSIVCTKKECFASCGAAPGGTALPLSISRRESYRVQGNGLSVRTVSGRLTVASGEARAGRGADLYRWAVTPELPNNFEVEDEQYDPSADGRHLDYSVTHREVMWSAPRPLLNPRASFSVSQQGLQGMADCSLTGSFEAPPAYGKNAILQRVGELLLSKLGTGSLTDESILWTDKSIVEEVYGNAVTFAFRWRESEIDSLLLRFGTQPPGSDGQAQPLGPYGGDGQLSDSGVRAGTPTAYDACTGGQLVNQSPRPPTGSPGSSNVPPRPGTTLSRPTNLPGYWTPSPDQLAGPYLEYHEIVSTEVDQGVVVFPSKVGGSPHVIQQTHNPVVYVTQVGYAVRAGSLDKAPPPAAPMYADQVGVMVGRPFVERENPKPLLQGDRYLMTVRWSYRFALRATPVNTAALGMTFPKDRRVEMQEPKVPEFGEVVPRGTLPSTPPGA